MRVVSISLVLLFAAVQAVWSEAELELRDGTVIRGEEVRREGELYIIALEGGERLSFPVALVEEVRLGGEGDEAGRAPGTGRDESDTREAGLPNDEAPSGPRRDRPRTLAGTEVRPRRPSEQTRVLGRSARFPRDIVDSRWSPRSDWEMNPSANDFNPSTWSKSPVDTGWKPRSAFDAGKDVLESGRSKWQKSIIDSGWRPRDAFGGRGAF